MIDNDFLFTDLQKKCGNQHTLPGKINTSVVVRFFVDHESIFFCKVTPTMTQEEFEISFQQYGIVAILSPVDTRIIGVLIQSLKKNAKLTLELKDPIGEH